MSLYDCILTYVPFHVEQNILEGFVASLSCEHGTFYNDDDYDSDDDDYDDFNFDDFNFDDVDYDGDVCDDDDDDNRDNVKWVARDRLRMV